MLTAAAALLAGMSAALAMGTPAHASLAQQAYLKASNASETDFFGASMAIDGETMVVGAPGEDSNAIGVNGDQANDDGPQQRRRLRVHAQ